ncbi:Heparinase II/III N-terminus [Caloramator quimbayensis]|uniref:Heparinase II/III N-terminus n=1 Tax=Caloramator quimbayensis TaxID=1147123 RepID=A0A1T4XGE1_9CLOT|nr:heparinase II/III family protein [Caloramator quimbayensis]SKA88590.1 Heparinase II/III N-terminus [Caloramator quimbayensis]
MPNITHKLLKYKNQPIKKLTKKALKKIKNKIYFSYRRYRVCKNPIDIPTDNFYSFYPKCSFFYDLKNREKYIEEIKKLGLENSIINDANLILEHKFNLLGSGEKYLGEKLPWNEDFKTGFRWENKFYKDIKIVDLNNNADVKVPWELSRFQHLFTLGKAYLITFDEKYALEFKDEIEDWILS